MANPQKENGYTPISNEIMDEVAKLQINATQFRILIVVWRYTYGFSRKEHTLSEGFISNATGIHKKRIGQELLDLIKRKVLTEEVAPSFASTRVISFNKNYQEWTNRDSQSINRQSMKTLTGSESIDQTVNENVDRTVNENVDQDKQYLKQILKQKEKGKKEAKLPIQYFDFEELNDAFLAFIEMRKKIKAPMTERAISLAISTLERLAKDDDYKKLAIVNESILHGWKGLFD